MFSARFFKAGGKHGQPGAMSRFHFDMGTSATAEPKFAFHGEALRLRGFDGASKQVQKTLYMSYITSGFSRFRFEDWTHFWKENACPIE